ncbi:hypothetical protein JJQ59_28525 [Cupriavidus necator]|nr:hypothetical protein [Cupriavidus necator]QQX86707.1 hypothetical protein JJQ59_28525 [Cupriavidus necator]
MNTTTESKQARQSRNEGQSLGRDVAPFWAKWGGRHREFNPAGIPEESYYGRDYAGFLLAPEDTSSDWLSPDVLPERKFMLVASKEPLYDAVRDGFRGFELCINEKSNGKSSPVIRIANRFEFHARHLIPFIGSASVLGGIPVLFADVNKDCFLVRYRFGTDAFIALHELTTQMVSA